LTDDFFLEDTGFDFAADAADAAVAVAVDEEFMTNRYTM
jgi:hypothetical protein